MTQKTLFSALTLSLLIGTSSQTWASRPEQEKSSTSVASSISSTNADFQATPEAATKKAEAAYADSEAARLKYMDLSAYMALMGNAEGKAARQTMAQQALEKARELEKKSIDEDNLLNVLRTQAGLSKVVRERLGRG